MRDSRPVLVGAAVDNAHVENVPPVVMLPIDVALLCVSVNQTVDAGPLAMAPGEIPFESGYSVIAPAVEIRPIKRVNPSLNQSAPSGPVVIAFKIVVEFERGYVVMTGWGLISPVPIIDVPTTVPVIVADAFGEPSHVPLYDTSTPAPGGVTVVALKCVAPDMSSSVNETFGYVPGPTMT